MTKKTLEPEMIDWTFVVCDSSTCKCQHDHGAGINAEDGTTRFADAKCKARGCGSCAGIAVTVKIPEGSNGPVLVRLADAAAVKAYAKGYADAGAVVIDSTGQTLAPSPSPSSASKD
jgi:hypothetical protein